jgi:hypothetical protein
LLLCEFLAVFLVSKLAGTAGVQDVFRWTHGIGLDGASNSFIADTGNSIILRVSASGLLLFFSASLHLLVQALCPHWLELLACLALRMDKERRPSSWSRMTLQWTPWATAT